MQPGGAARDGLLGEIPGSALQGTIASFEGSREVGIGDVEASGDETGDEVGAAHSAAAGCLGESFDALVEHGSDVVDLSDWAGCDEVGECGADIDPASLCSPEGGDERPLCVARADVFQ
ncbi:MAG: hypothetical protein ACLQNG_13495, partial [Acidimicrobiales bacterium]